MTLKNSNNIKVSIIMPLYNVEKTLAIALESILMQNTNFRFEIIAVDDCSEDNTYDILSKYASKYTNIRIIRHTTNCGNAVAFHSGLSMAEGDYFCVLDGDDYYTVKYKLQRQVDFLDSDKDEIYTAVAHKYLRVNNCGLILDDAQIFSKAQEHNYQQFLQQDFYYHTSTYMYRNIFKHNVPEILKSEYFRGDNPRTFIHLTHTKGKIKILNFVGSVYRYDENGIWSKLTYKEQIQRNINTIKAFQDYTTTNIEKSILNKTIEKFKKKEINNKRNSYKFLTKEELLQKVNTLANRYAFLNRDFAFKSLYKSSLIDSICESIGFISILELGLLPLDKIKNKDDSILITVAKLSTNGGGIYYEIKDIISMYQDKKVYLLLTDLDDNKDLDSEVLYQLSKYNNLTLLYGQNNNLGKINNLFSKLVEVKPNKIYHYLGHNNVFAATLVQSVFNKNICVFSFDHGFSLGLEISSYDKYITKRPMDFEILSKRYGNKVIYIPCWQLDKIKGNYYIPFKEHNKLITACGTARFYKLETEKKDGYVNLIIELLKETKGKHIHYGTIPENKLTEIKENLLKNNIKLDQFIYIPWAENIPLSLYENKVDIFIEPYPVVSYKLTLEVLSAGVPVIVKNGNNRIEITDFIYPGCIKWETQDNFINTLKNLTKEELQRHSLLSREYYVNNHLPEKLLPYFINEKNLCIPKHIPFNDATLIDCEWVENLLLKAIEQKAKNKNKKNKNNILKNIFSIQNENIRKIITIMGIKIKIKSKQLTSRKNFKQLSTDMYTITDYIIEANRNVNNRLNLIQNEQQKIYNLISELKKNKYNYNTQEGKLND